MRRGAASEALADRERLFVQLPQEECEGADHPRVLAARNQVYAS
jgi:hypothetical protein